MQTWVLRFAPGVDLVESLREACMENGWTAAFVLSGVGSLQQAPLRFAAAREATEIAGPLELVSLQGTLAIEGPLLHATVADAQGRVSGGQLRPGAKIHATAEILVGVLPDVVFRRRPDVRTGQAELIIEPRPPVPDA